METHDRNWDLRDAFTLEPIVANLFQEAPLCCSVLAGALGRQTAVLPPGRHFFIIPSAGSFQPPYVQSNPLMWPLAPGSPLNGTLHRELAGPCPQLPASPSPTRDF